MPVRSWYLQTLLPAAFLGAVVFAAILGDNGVFARRKLVNQLDAANRDLVAVEAENQAMLRELRAMDQDPRALERLVYDELGWAREGEELYRFDADAVDESR